MIYLDNSATTKPYDDVLQSYITVAQNYFGNPSSLHALGGKRSGCYRNLVLLSRDYLV
ncbi:hypothetical protein GCM10020331_031620 [Ectobacillus funiculus]